MLLKDMGTDKGQACGYALYTLTLFFCKKVACPFFPWGMITLNALWSAITIGITIIWVVLKYMKKTDMLVLQETD